MFSVEQWKSVVGYEGLYEVSDHGRVRSGRKVLKPVTLKNGYNTVRPSKNGRQKTTYIQHLVLEAFVGPRPAGLYALHGDGDRTNNRLDNLRWGTPEENMADAEIHGTVPKGSQRHNARFDEFEVSVMRQLRGIINSFEWSKELGVDASVIRAVIRGRDWKHVAMEPAYV